MLERPLDFLQQNKGKRISIYLKHLDKVVEGILLVYDIHLNVVIEINGLNYFYAGRDIVSFAEIKQKGERMP